MALGASLFHLGRPQFAFRAVLGLRHSWLSREIVAFGAFAALASLYSGAIFVAQVMPETNAAGGESPSWIRWLGWSVAATGVIAVFCSTMIYVFTQRECWSFARVGVRFALTSALLGVAAVWLSILATDARVAIVTRCLHWFTNAAPTLCWTLVRPDDGQTRVGRQPSFATSGSRKMTPLKRSALLMTGDLSNATLARFALGLLGGAILPTMLAGRRGNSSAMVPD